MKLFQHKELTALQAEVAALREQLAEAEAQAAQVTRLQRELRQRDERIAFLEGEVERARAALYAADARTAQQQARAQRVLELLTQGYNRKQTAIEVFGYNGGYATNFVAQIAEARYSNSSY